MTGRSYESAWLAYVVANTRANTAYRARTAKLHRAYTARVRREIASAVRERVS